MNTDFRHESAQQLRADPVRVSAKAGSGHPTSSVGLQARGRVPFASTFAAFLSRAYDFIRIAAGIDVTAIVGTVRTITRPAADGGPR